MVCKKPLVVHLCKRIYLCFKFSFVRRYLITQTFTIIFLQEANSHKTTPEKKHWVFLLNLCSCFEVNYFQVFKVRLYEV